MSKQKSMKGACYYRANNKEKWLIQERILITGKGLKAEDCHNQTYQGTVPATNEHTKDSQFIYIFQILTNTLIQGKKMKPFHTSNHMIYAYSQTHKWHTMTTHMAERYTILEHNTHEYINERKTHGSIDKTLRSKANAVLKSELSASHDACTGIVSKSHGSSTKKQKGILQQKSREFHILLQQLTQNVKH